MIEGYSPIVQSLLGTIFTWGLTAIGAGLVFVFSSGQVCLVQIDAHYTKCFCLLEKCTRWKFRFRGWGKS